METKSLIQNLRIGRRRSPRLRNSAAVQMARTAANERLRRIRHEVCVPSWNGGLETIMSETSFDFRKDVAGEYLAFKTVAAKRESDWLPGADVTQRQAHFSANGWPARRKARQRRSHDISTFTFD